MNKFILPLLLLLTGCASTSGDIHIAPHGRIYKNNWFYVEGLFAELDQPGE